MLSDSPPDRDLQWTDTGIAASFKFINKLYEFVYKFKNYKNLSLDDSGLVEGFKNYNKSGFRKHRDISI